jgi:hypothetical protein
LPQKDYQNVVALGENRRASSMLPAIPAENFHRRVTRLDPFLMLLVDFELILSSEYVFATHEMMRPFKTPKNSTNYLEPNDGNEQKHAASPKSSGAALSSGGLGLYESLLIFWYLAILLPSSSSRATCCWRLFLKDFSSSSRAKKSKTRTPIN